MAHALVAGIPGTDVGTGVEVGGDITVWVDGTGVGVGEGEIVFEANGVVICEDCGGVDDVIFAILRPQAESTAVAPAPANSIRKSRRDIPEARAFFHNTLVSSSFGCLVFILRSHWSYPSYRYFTTLSKRYNPVFLLQRHS